MLRAASATPARTAELRTGGRHCETHIPRVPHVLASKTTIYWAGSRTTDERHPLLRVLYFPPTLTFLSREDRPSAGQENCDKRPLGSATGEEALVPLLLSRSRGLAGPRRAPSGSSGVLLTDPLGGGCSATARRRPAQTATPLPPHPSLSALPPDSARHRPLADTQLPPTLSPRIFRD